ncbi:unnamed protein product [Effrenium voratum]|nr:unnamed protein product [Effrenium voratum]
MASLTMAFGMCEEEVAADLSCWSLYVSERIYTTDWEILRGISLRDSFRFGGSLWRNRQRVGAGPQADLFHQSRHVEQLVPATWVAGSRVQSGFQEATGGSGECGITEGSKQDESP